jgi:hypothetical protein
VEAVADRIVQAMLSFENRADVLQSGPHRRCLVAGLIDGGHDALDAIQATCSETCFLNGEFVGTVSAQRYCEAAISTDGDVQAEAWTRQPVNLCGFDFESSCDATFWGVSTSYQNDQGQCLPYTYNEFFQTWDNTRLRACDYQEYRQQLAPPRRQY